MSQTDPTQPAKRRGGRPKKAPPVVNLDLVNPSQSQIADALNIRQPAVAYYAKRGMPAHEGVTMREIIEWVEKRKAERVSPKGPDVKPVDPSSANMSLDDRIARQKLLVAEAENVWRSSMQQSNGNSSKFQTAYNQSLKTLLALEREAFERKVKEREYIRLTDAEDMVSRIAHTAVSALEGVTNTSDRCNPENPAAARKVLEAYVIDKRNELAEAAKNASR